MGYDYSLASWTNLGFWVGFKEEYTAWHLMPTGWIVYGVSASWLHTGSARYTTHFGFLFEAVYESYANETTMAADLLVDGAGRSRIYRLLHTSKVLYFCSILPL